MQVLYYDCFAGISGDRHLGALLDLGVPEAHVREELTKLGFAAACDWRTSHAVHQGIRGTRVEFFRGPKVQGEEAVAARWSWAEIRQCLLDSKLPEATKDLALRLFTTLVTAKARVQGQAVTDVTFRPGEAQEALVALVGAAIVFRYLEIEQVHVSAVELGNGMVHKAQGLLPVPTPTTADLLAGWSTLESDIGMEATTAIGAAIVRTMGTHERPAAPVTITTVGYGLGHAPNPKTPNVFRVRLGYVAEDEDAAPVEAETLGFDWQPSDWH